MSSSFFFSSWNALDSVTSNLADCTNFMHKLKRSMAKLNKKQRKREKKKCRTLFHSFRMDGMNDAAFMFILHVKWTFYLWTFLKKFIIDSAIKWLLNWYYCEKKIFVFFSSFNLLMEKMFFFLCDLKNWYLTFFFELWFVVNYF